MKKHKKAALIILCLITILSVMAYLVFHIAKVPPVPAKDSNGLRIMSYNLRFASDDYEYWNSRKELIVEQIKKYRPDSIGIQEGNYEWMSENDGLPSLLDEYLYVGVGRDDGKTDGEYNAVFYLADKFEVLDSGTFWLSETPEIPSFGWDAACRRLCTWVTLRNKYTDEIYTHYNTHLDHEGKTAREKATELILQEVKDSFYPFVITGDFNFLEGSKNYKVLTESDVIRDAKYEAEDTMSHGTMNWFLHMNFRLVPPIDFCFISRDFYADRYRVDNTYWFKSNPVSDHFPVIVDLHF